VDKNIYNAAKEHIYDYASLHCPEPYNKRQDEDGVFWEEDGCMISIDLSGEDFITFKAYPGIVVPPAFYEPVTEYCLRNTSAILSWFKIDTSNGEIACVSSLPIIEYAIEFLTIDMVVGYLLGQVKKHKKNLEDLAYGRRALSELSGEGTASISHQIEEDYKLVSEERWKAQIAVIRDYLSGNGHHGFYSESFDSVAMTPSWRVELGVDDTDCTPIGFHTYTLFYQLDRQGFLEIGACKGKQGTIIESAYNQKVVRKLLYYGMADDSGNFSVGEFCPGVSFQRRIGFIDRLITEETLGRIDSSVIGTIEKIWRELETSGHGLDAGLWRPENDSLDEGDNGSPTDDEELPFT